jgi:hypothetical protein
MRQIFCGILICDYMTNILLNIHVEYSCVNINQYRAHSLSFHFPDCFHSAWAEDEEIRCMMDNEEISRRMDNEEIRCRTDN